MPELVPVTLTPQETAEFEATEAGPAPLNPIHDLNAQEIFDLATNDTSFDIAAEFTRNKDLWGDQAIVQKTADAFHMLRQRGFKLSDLPSPSKVVGAVADIGKGFLKQAKNYASAALSPVVGAVGELTGQDAGFHEAVGQDAQQKVAENIAGSEASVSGLADMASRGVGKIARGLGISKSLDEYSPEEKVKELFAATGPVEQQQEIAKGKGAFLTPVGGEVVKELEQADKGVRPEEVAALAPGDPLAWWTFGKALGNVGKAIPFKPQLAKAGEKIGEAATVAGGRTIQALGEATRVGSKVVGKVAPIVGAIKGGIEAGPLGVLAGTKVGEITKSITKRGVAAGEAVSNVGKQIAGAAPLVSPIAQLGKDVIQSVPGAAARTAEGLAMDIGFAAATSETPAETEAGVGIGAALGGLHGAAGAGRRILSGQLIAPRAWGSQVARPSSGKHPAFDTMHKAAYEAASPGQKERLNAIREFVKGAAPETDVFLGSDPASIERALVASGVSPESAKASARQEGFFTTSIDGKPVIVLRDADTAPHEAFHAFQDVLGEQGNLAVDKIIRDSYADRWDVEGQRYADRLAGKPVENWRDTVLEGSGWGQLHAVEKSYMDVANRLRAEQGAEPRPADVEAIVRSEAQGKDWRSILTPEEQTAAADKYLARELAAENFDAVFKNLGGSLKEQTGVIPKLARIVGNVVSALGGEPLAGRESDFGRVPLRADAVEAVKGAVRENKPSIEPLAPKKEPSPRPVPSSDPAEEAKAIAESAPETPVAGGTRSPKELLGEVAQAIASRKGIKINYLSAPGEPAAATSSNRDARREVIETFRTMPPSARALWEKNFFPDRVVKLKGEKYQVLGWAPEVFASNAHKMAKALKGNETLSPYEISGDTFSEKGWRDLFADVETFSRNQVAGQTGAGEPLVVPKSVKDRGFYAPASKSNEAAPLDQRKADFINVLFGYKLPETPRIQKGKLPLNIAGQEVSTATKPGRIRVPVVPKGKFEGAEAEKQNIEGREILEVNPLRNELQAALGDKYPSLVEAQQRLALESIKEVQVAPEQPEFRANTLTLTAGFQPMKNERAIKAAAVRDPEGKVYEGTAHYIAFDNAAKETKYKFEDFDTGFITNNGEFLDRNQAFQRAEELGQAPESTDGKLRSNTTIDIQAQPLADKARSIKDMTDEQWMNEVQNFKGTIGSGPTGWGFDLGSKIKTADDLAALKSTAESMQEITRAAIAAKDFDAAGRLATRWQIAHEAYQAATGEKLDGTPAAVDFIRRHYKPDYVPPMPGEAFKLTENKLDIPAASAKVEGVMSTQAQPKRNEEVARIADDYSKVTGIAPRKVNIQPVPEATAEKIADWYESAKHAPDDADVKASYDSLVKETEDQYNAITEAGYTIEPYTGKGEPYKNSAEMVADVTDNKHLYFLPTKGNFSGDENNHMLKPSKIDGMLVNDVFRAVHDFFGHAKEGLQFGPKGEFNAWREHSAMYSDDAQAALASKTLAQNFWVNFGKQVRGKSIAPKDRPFAEQKNVFVPESFLNELRPVQAQPKKAKDQYKFPKTSAGGIRKIWVLPSGDVAQLGGTWHHEWLAENPEIAKKYGLNIPKFEGTDSENVREEAMKKGFIRVNNTTRDGNLIIEGRARDWRKVKTAMENLVERNIDDIDNVTVHLFDDKISKVVDSETRRLFVHDNDADKLANLPFSEREPRGIGAVTQAQPERAEEDNTDLFGKKDVITGRQSNDMTRDELKRHYPEAIVPKDRKESIPSEIVLSPRYKRAGGEREAVTAFGGKLVEFAKENMDRPEFKAGKKWYSEFVPRLKKEFGKDAQVMAELLAATSPQTNVETNFAYALDALESLKSGRFEKIIGKFNQGLEMIEDGKWEAWYKRNLKNIPNPPAEPTPAAFLAHWIETNKLKPRQSNGKLYGQHSLPVLQVFARRWLSTARGPKTLNFVENLLGSGHEATIDLWADRTMRRIGYADFADRWRILPQNIGAVSEADFAFAQKAFRRAAEQLKMNPDDLQGALWFAEKQLWADNGWSRLDLGDFRREMDKVPLLKQGIKHRLDKTKARDKIKPAQELELLVEPR